MVLSVVLLHTWCVVLSAELLRMWCEVFSTVPLTKQVSGEAQVLAQEVADATAPLVSDPATSPRLPGAVSQHLSSILRESDVKSCLGQLSS